MKTKNINLLVVSVLVALVLGLATPPVVRAETMTVDTTEDVLNPSGNGRCSLREAILNANNDNKDFPDCPQGSGADEIRVPPGHYTLALGYLSFTDDETTQIVNDGGSGQAGAVIIDGGQNNRVFQVTTTASAHLKGLNITRGQVSSFGKAGGIWNVGNLTLEYCAIYDNQCGYDGGGIYNDGTLTVYNSTFYDNRATSRDGGGIFNASGGTVTLNHVTLSGNSTGRDGGGLYGSVIGGISATNSIIAGNTAGNTGGDCGGQAVTHPGGSIDSDSSCGVTTAPGLTLDPLGWRGGTTQTCALQAGTLPIDYIPPAAGGCGSSDTDDQRFAQRPVDGGTGNVWCDAGAFEYDSPTLIELASFTGRLEEGVVRLAWETASEVDQAGFNLWRSDSQDSDHVRLNEALIPAQGNSFLGASYSFDDVDVAVGPTYDYKLETVDIHGRSTFHGPVQVTVGEMVRVYLPVLGR